MGLRSISAYLKLHGHSTRMIFLPYLFPEIAYEKDFSHAYSPRVLEQLVALTDGCQLAGVTLMTNYYERAVQITRALRTARPDLPIVWGGIHASIRPEECLKDADAVCIHEGEQAMLELANRMVAGQSYLDVQSFWFRDGNGGIIRNPLRSPIENLDDLPFFDYDLTDHHVLLQERDEIVKMDKDILRHCLTKEAPTKARAALFYQTIASRGCPHACTFCCWSALAREHNIRRGIRRRSNAHIMEELRWVRRELPFIKEITFSDDSFLACSVRDAQEFRDMYVQDIGLPFQCLAEPHTITADKLAAFVDAGLVNIQIGIQTGSERMKKMYRRVHSNERIVEMHETIIGHVPRIRPPIYDFILDNPWETQEDLIETLKLLLSLRRPYFLQIFSLVFFPGTDLFERARTEGLITDELQEIYRAQYNTRQINYINLLFSLFSHNFPLPLLRILAKPGVVRLLNKPQFNGAFKLLWAAYRRLKLLSIRIMKGKKQK